jgi:hypothetical protein
MLDGGTFRRRLMTGWLIFASIVLPGCKPSTERPVYPVKGQVFVSSRPAEGALVILRPAGEPNPQEWTSGYPRGNVAADGTFQVSTYGTGDGAPAGEYTVLVQWLKPLAGAAQTADPEAPVADRLGGRYMDPAKSKLRAIVEEKPTELPRFDLK